MDDLPPRVKPPTATASVGVIKIDRPSGSRFFVQFPEDGWDGLMPVFDKFLKHPLMLPFNRFLSGGSNDLGAVAYYALKLDPLDIPYILHAVAFRYGTSFAGPGPENAIHIFPGLLADWDFGDGKPISIHHLTVRPTNRGTIRRYVRRCRDDGTAEEGEVLAENDRPVHGAQYLMATCIRDVHDLWPAGTVTREISDALADRMPEIRFRGGVFPEHVVTTFPMLPKPSFLMTIYSLGEVRDDLSQIMPKCGELYKTIFGKPMDFPPDAMRGAVASYGLEGLGFRRMTALHVTHIAIPRALPRRAVIDVAGLDERFSQHAEDLRTGRA